MALSLAYTDAQLLQDLADEVKKTLGGLPDYWNRIVSQSHAWAVGRIVASLVSRGYTYQQILSADQTPDYERGLTLYMTLKRAGTVEGYKADNLKALDFSDDLKHDVLTVGGAFIVPGGSVGIPNTGLTNAPDDIFQYPPTNGDPPFPPGEFANDQGEGSKW